MMRQHSILFLLRYYSNDPSWSDHADDFSYEDIEYMRVDTLVSERMTSSPNIIDTYGYCGLASLSEYALHGSVDNDIVPDVENDGDWTSVNRLSPIQKIQYALQIAEAVADLHGFADGIIVHHDQKLDQFMWNADKTRIRLNDFNRAVFMTWDDTTRQYCRFNEEEVRLVSPLQLCANRMTNVFHTYL
jgi:serine/threonine protein kinase